MCGTEGKHLGLLYKVMSMDKYRELLFLKELNGVGPVRINKFYVPLLQNGMDIDLLVKTVRDNEKKADEENIRNALSVSEAVYNKMTSIPDIKIVTITDDDYPSKIKDMGNNAPVILYVKGDLSPAEAKTIAVVGTREPSEWSVKVEKQLVGKILELSGGTIVSGLALGCDAIGHKACIDNGGKTIAMLPCGFDRITPSENENLSREIVAKGGALITEYLPEMEATTYTFVERDELIAAISDATLVIECGIKSGTMHTVKAALSYAKKLAAFHTDTGKGTYDGNDYIISEKGGFAVSDTDSLKIFLDSIGVKKIEEEPKQLSLFDFMGDN